MFAQIIVQKLNEAVTIPQEKISELLEVPPESSMGDFAFPCFLLAKERKKAPIQIAQDLAQELVCEGVIENIEATGPYVNFFIKPSAWPQTITEELWAKGKSENVLIEFPSPNTNKPLHLGHLRNMIIATTLRNILKTAGKTIKTANLNNDRGVHICKSMLAYKLFGEGKEPDKKTDHFVGDWYVRFAEEVEKNPDLQEQAQEMLRKWEDGDAETVALWKKMNSWAYAGWQETFKEFSVSFDKEYYESKIYKEGKEIILKNKELFAEDEGAIIANLDEYKLPKKVLLRSDGTAIYMTQDIALTLIKQKDFTPDKQVWVVGNEQELHFKQLFAILDMLGQEKDHFFHFSYGMIELPSGKMKSREGTTVEADDLLVQVRELAQKNIRERHKEWSEEKIMQTAHDVAIAAIRFFIIKYDPQKNFVFDIESSLSFEGDTGPYLQYTHARISSILRKSEEKGDLGLLGKEEAAVAKEVQKLREAFTQAQEHYKLHAVAQQTVQVARELNSYYHAQPVLKAAEEIRGARLSFLRAVKNVLSESMSLMGVTALEEM